MKNELIIDVVGYRVSSSDTLSEVIERFLPGPWTDWIDQVKTLNGMILGATSLIYAGQIILLPEKAKERKFCSCCGKPL